jgi:hypothetical protein
MENYDDQLSRLNLMADDDGTSWDLSENDQAAISAVIDKLSSVEAERDALAALVVELRGALEEIADDGIERSRDPRTRIATAALARLEGK